MNMPYRGMDGFRKGLMFCVCFVFLGAMAPSSRGNSENFARQHVIQSNIKNATLRQATAEKRVVVARTYGKLPLYFIANQGQVNGKVAFYETGAGHTTFFTRKGIVLSLRKADGKVNRIGQEVAKTKGLPGKSAIRKTSESRASYLRIRMLAMSKDVEIVPEDVQPGRVNYFIGNDPHKWRTNIPAYKAVLYRNAYPGIDIKFYGNNRKLEYDIIVKPGADPSEVKFQYTGAKDIHVTKTGDLAVELNGGRLIQRKPNIYQEINGRRVLCQGSFKVKEDKFTGRFLTGSTTAIRNDIRTFTCSFGVGTYDRRAPLVVDPVLVYSTYLGGGGVDSGNGIAVDGNGNVYITGDTNSTDFPTKSPIQGYNAGMTAAFVTEIAADGTSLVYSTYLGGSDNEKGFSIAVDGSGDAYVYGITKSKNFPTKNAIQANLAGDDDAFITEIAPGGTGLVYSTYLGGSGSDGADQGQLIAVDRHGDAYVTGSTTSTDFPTKNPIQANFAGGAIAGDAFIAEIAAGGRGLVYSTYLGGSGNEWVSGIAVDGNGNAYITGGTDSTDFPTKNPMQEYNAGTEDGFVTEIAAGGTALVYSTYLGGSSGDFSWVIAVDGNGNAYITGETNSTDFPIKNAIQPHYVGNHDDFAAEIKTGGSEIVYSTYLGGSGDNYIEGIAVDGNGNAYITGMTDSTDFPTKDAIQANFGGGMFDAFVTEIAAGGSGLVYSTYLGGADNDSGGGIAVDGNGNAYITGETSSTDFPTKNPIQTSNAGSDDVFVTKISAQTGGLWQNAKDLGSGWKWLNWFGYFNTNSSPWIYHMQHGWLYTFGTSTDNIWFYDAAMGSFWWTSATVYPYVYRASDGAWLYYDVGTSNPRWFFNYSTNKWEKH